MSMRRGNPARNDPRWITIDVPKDQRRTCRSCTSNGYPVRMRIWSAPLSWQCPCCSFTIPIDRQQSEAMRIPKSRPPSLWDSAANYGNRYADIPDALFALYRHRAISPRQFMVATAMIVHDNPSVQRLAAITGFDERIIRQDIAYLDVVGFRPAGVRHDGPR